MEEVALFFSRFQEDFASFNGRTIASRYIVPFMSINTEGSISVFSNHPDIEELYQRYLDDYLAQGIKSCRFKDLEYLPLGRNCICATVTWEMLSPRKDVVTTWRESYNLMRHGDELKIFSTIDH